MSTHSVDVIKIQEVLPHPNADRLEIIKIEEYTCCVRKGDFKAGDLAAYIEPDYVVDIERPEFSFVPRPRIKVKKLRGIISQGLIIPAPEGSQEGDNVMEQLGVTRYVPPMNGINRPKFRAMGEKAPEGYHPKYDLENWRKYSRLLEEGEEVFITEKIHGANARFKHDGEKMHLGSRSMWVKDDQTNPWSLALEQNPWIRSFCENNPNLTVYGEIFGWVQDLKYGHSEKEISFAAFDILQGNRWWDYDEISSIFAPLNCLDPSFEFQEGKHLWSVPILCQELYSKDIIRELVDGKSEIPGADHIREGIVVKPIRERTDVRLGRVALKVVSDDYLERH